jgi:hypothetical protein
MKKIIIVVIALCLLVFGVYTAIWHYASHKHLQFIQTSLAEAAQEMQKSDVKLSYGTITKSGFPNAIGLNIPHITISEAAGEKFVMVLNDITTHISITDLNTYNATIKSIAATITDYQKNVNNINISFDKDAALNSITKINGGNLTQKLIIPKKIFISSANKDATINLISEADNPAILETQIHGNHLYKVLYDEIGNSSVFMADNPENILSKSGPAKVEYINKDSSNDNNIKLLIDLQQGETTSSTGKKITYSFLLDSNMRIAKTHDAMDLNLSKLVLNVNKLNLTSSADIKLSQDDFMPYGTADIQLEEFKQFIQPTFLWLKLLQTGNIIKIMEAVSTPPTGATPEEAENIKQFAAFLSKVNKSAADNSFLLITSRQKLGTLYVNDIDSVEFYDELSQFFEAPILE